MPQGRYTAAACKQGRCGDAPAPTPTSCDHVTASALELSQRMKRTEAMLGDVLQMRAV